ncbi:MAG: Fic family protein [bacterium]
MADGFDELKNIDDIVIYEQKINEYFKPDKDLSFFTAKKEKTEYIYNVVYLEGNPMTYPEVETLLEGITVGGHKISDELQVLNQNKSVEYLFSIVKNNGFKLDKETFCKLNRFVSFEESPAWGEFRTGNIRIGGTEYIPPKAEELDKIFNNRIEKIKQIENPVIKSFVFFGFGCRNQFFWDGNKRTSRLMTNGILLSNGYFILNIKSKDKKIFNETMIDFYNTGDYKKLVGFFTDYYIEQNLMNSEKINVL